MSYASCLTAALTLMKAALPEFTTVDLRQNVPSPYTPDRYPMLLLDHGKSKESRLGLPVASSNSGGRKLRIWPMTAYVWDWEPGIAWDETAFLGYVETVENTLRLNNRLANAGLGVNADTDTSFVITSAEDGIGGIGLQSHTEMVQNGTSGLIRYGEIICLVQEGIYG